MAGKVPAKLRRICLALPEATEVLVEAWGGEPTYRVRNKVFVFAGETGMSIKAHPDEREALLGDSRFRPAPYLARGGWVNMDLTGKVDWDEVDELVRTSYTMVAPKTLARLVHPD